MRSRVFLLIAAVMIYAAFWGAGWRSLMAQGNNSTALSGQVTSTEEGPMEGVLVIAKSDNTPLTITVVSDQTGRYVFPRITLAPGHYSVGIRAVGYDLEKATSVDVSPGKSAALDLKLVKTKDLSSQLTSTEWILSAPGTDEQKGFLRNCTNCHSMERIVKSKHNAAEWVEVIKRMALYAPPSSPFGPVKVPGSGTAAEPVNLQRAQKQAEYLASINLSKSSTWPYALKTLPRPKGRATQAVITEYALPRKTTQPHDAVRDQNGMIWYADFAKPYLGRLNPRTGEVKEWTVPEMIPGFPEGSLDVEFDKQGNIWLGRMMQGGVAEFDPKAEKWLGSWKAPKPYNNDSVRTAMVAPENRDVDGKVWFDNAAANRVIHRLDVKTGEVETFDVYKEIGKDAPDGTHIHSNYGIASDAENNLYFTDMAGGNIARVDAKTGKLTLFPTPTKNSAPRRIRMDSKGRLWFGENAADRIGMFDLKTQQFREWKVPTPWSHPYDAVLDKDEEAWAGSTFNDRIQRLNTKNGEIVEYLLPHATNIRRVYVDDKTTPVTFWAGNNHGASIIKLEPKD